MKTIVFIDGENFMHQVRDVLYRQHRITNRDELAEYDIRALLERTLEDIDAQRVKIYYYAAMIHIVNQTPELKERTSVIKAWNERLKVELAKRDIDFVEAGHLLVRDGKKCPECGHREPALTEKGVDVQLATDLIRASGDNLRLVLFSSDGDLMPAVIESQRRGAEIFYLGFRGVSNATLSRAADKRATINSKQVVAVFNKQQPQSQKLEAVAGEIALPQQSEKAVRSRSTKPTSQPKEVRSAHGDLQPPAEHRHEKAPAKSAAPKRTDRRQNNSQRPEKKPQQPSVFTGSMLASMFPAPSSKAPVKKAKDNGPKPK